MGVEVSRCRRWQGETDFVFQRRVENPDHQLRAAEHGEVEVDVGLGDGERRIFRLVVAVDAQVFVPAVGLEEARILAVQRRDVEPPIGFLRHRAGKRSDAADHIALGFLLHGQGELVEVHTFVGIEEALLADVIRAVVVIDHSGLSPAVDLDPVFTLKAVAEHTAHQRTHGIVCCQSHRGKQNLGTQNGRDQGCCANPCTNTHTCLPYFY
ncbi:hypothetical protein D3C85_1027670 [compost metagenome]